MFLPIAVSVAIYICLYLLLSIFLMNLPLLGVVALIYFIPLIINGVMILLLYIKKSNLSLIECYVFPLISTISYWIFGISSNAWHQFVSKYTVNNGDMYVKVHSNLIDASQLIFVIFLYFSVQFLVSLIIRKIKGKINNENN